MVGVNIFYMLIYLDLYLETWENTCGSHRVHGQSSGANTQRSYSWRMQAICLLSHRLPFDYDAVRSTIEACYWGWHSVQWRRKDRKTKLFACSGPGSAQTPVSSQGWDQSRWWLWNFLSAKTASAGACNALLLPWGGKVVARSWQLAVSSLVLESFRFFWFLPFSSKCFPSIRLLAAQCFLCSFRIPEQLETAWLNLIRPICISSIYLFQNKNFRVEETEVFHPLVHSSDSQNGWGCARLNPGTRNLIKISQWERGPSCLDHIPLLFPGQ